MIVRIQNRIITFGYFLHSMKMWEEQSLEIWSFDLVIHGTANTLNSMHKIFNTPMKHIYKRVEWKYTKYKRPNRLIFAYNMYFNDRPCHWNANNIVEIEYCFETSRIKVQIRQYSYLVERVLNKCISICEKQIEDQNKWIFNSRYLLNDINNLRLLNLFDSEFQVEYYPQWSFSSSVGHNYWKSNCENYF